MIKAATITTEIRSDFILALCINFCLFESVLRMWSVEVRVSSNLNILSLSEMMKF